MPTDGSSSDSRLSSESKEKVRFVVNATEKNGISALRSDVDELSKDVHTAVGDLKKSIADIRSTVSEMENPFNVLRNVTNDEELAKLNGGKLPPGVQSIVLGKPEDHTISDIEEKTELTPKIESSIKEKTPITSQLIAPAKPIKPAAYIDWIWNLLDTGLNAQDIRQLANLCEMTNYLPKQASEFVYAMAVTAEKIRLIGYTKGHMLLFMYKAASISKTNIDPEDMATLIELTEQQLKNQKGE